ncbi:MAG TPA: hypothetical protein VF529_14095 [Solirubrobacteraceae bacterium]
MSVAAAAHATRGETSRAAESAQVTAARDAGTLFQVFPRLRGAIDEDDPAGTGRRLSEMGFRVSWIYSVYGPDGVARGTRVPSPPADSRVLTVLNARGGIRATRRTTRLLVELTARGAGGIEGHHVAG